MTTKIKKQDVDIDVFHEFGKLKSFGGKTLNEKKWKKKRLVNVGMLKRSVKRRGW